MGKINLHHIYVDDLHGQMADGFLGGGQRQPGTLQQCYNTYSDVVASSGSDLSNKLGILNFYQSVRACLHLLMICFYIVSFEATFVINGSCLFLSQFSRDVKQLSEKNDEEQEISVFKSICQVEVADYCQVSQEIPMTQLSAGRKYFKLKKNVKSNINQVCV